VGFGVNLRALEGLARLLDRRATEVDHGQQYLALNAVIDDAGPLAAVEHLRTAHPGVVSHLDGVLAGYAGTLSGRAARVRAAIAGYTTSDQGTADLFGALPAHHGRLPGPVDATLGPEVFDDSWVAADRLRFPPDYRSEYPVTPQWTGPLSVARAQHRIAVWLVSPQDATPTSSWADFYTRPTRSLCGDWPGVAASAYAFGSLADALAAVRDSIADAVGTLSRVWSGEAGARCASVLDADSAALDRIAGTLTTLAATYRPVADAARAAEAAVDSLLAALVDDAALPWLGIGTGILAIPATLRLAEEARARLYDARRRAQQAASATLTLIAPLASPR
jgi:uncharacterized protein YukE